MYKKMLVLLDGSELAEIVFPSVTELAARLDAQVMLLHVYRSGLEAYAPMHRAYLEHIAKLLKKQIGEIRRQFKEKRKPLRISGDLVVGYTADEILRYVDDKNVDLIIMASHGRSGLRRWTLGSVADKIIRATKVPVWLIHAGEENVLSYNKWPELNLLVPLDGTEVAEVIFDHVDTLALQHGITIKVVLLRACDTPVAPSYYSPELTGVPLNWGDFMEKEISRCKHAAEEYLSRIADRFRKKGISRIETVIPVGKAADVIINYANKNPFTVILMTTHGRSGFRRFVYGSVAESTLMAVSNPMLLVKPQQFPGK